MKWTKYFSPNIGDDYDEEKENNIKQEHEHELGSRYLDNSDHVQYAESAWEGGKGEGA